LPNSTCRRGGHPNPRKTILHQQVEDLQSIPVVCLLFAHHRRADLRRIANPKFMPIVTEHLFEPLRGEGGFYADADGSRQCSIKPLGLARAMLQAARYKFARRGIHHCDFLKPCVKITSYNQHSRSAPFLRALVEETATKSTRPEGADDVIQSIKLVVRLLTEISKSHNSFLWRQLTASGDRKSTRLNSSHDQISYAVFCLKKKKNILYASIH